MSIFIVQHHRSECKIDCHDRLLLKSERLFAELPVIALASEEHKEYLKKIGININKTDIDNIRKERQIFYDKICNSMNVNGLNIVV